MKFFIVITETVSVRSEHIFCSFYTCLPTARNVMLSSYCASLKLALETGMLLARADDGLSECFRAEQPCSLFFNTSIETTDSCRKSAVLQSNIALPVH